MLFQNITLPTYLIKSELEYWESRPGVLWFIPFQEESQFCPWIFFFFLFIRDALKFPPMFEHPSFVLSDTCWPVSLCTLTSSPSFLNLQHYCIMYFAIRLSLPLSRWWIIWANPLMSYSFIFIHFSLCFVSTMWKVFSTSIFQEVHGNWRQRWAFWWKKKCFILMQARRPSNNSCKKKKAIL